MMKKILCVLLAVLCMSVAMTSCKVYFGEHTAYVKDKITEKSVAVNADVNWINKNGFFCEFSTDKSIDELTAELNEKNDEFFAAEHSGSNEEYICIQTYNKDVPFLIIAKVGGCDDTYIIQSEVVEFDVSDDLLTNWLFSIADGTPDTKMYYPLHLNGLFHIEKNGNQFDTDIPNPFAGGIKTNDHHIMMDIIYFYESIPRYETDLTDENGNKSFSGSDTKKFYLDVWDSVSDLHFTIVFNTDVQKHIYSYRFELES